MRKRGSIILAISAVLCFWGAGLRNRPLVEMRQDYDPALSKPLENAPPLVVFSTVVFGGFRGLVTDYLWVRLSLLQAAGKYIEVVQLSDWITKLEPRCGEVWAFHGWNMAYNVSVMMPDFEDRWRWVRNGVQLLRDEGLLYNPSDEKVYYQLGLIFQDKMGGSGDSAAEYYRQAWAKEMTGVLGGPRPDYEKILSNPDSLRRLKDEYRLLPAIMLEVETKYGELDWTLPETHAVYWAHQGLKFSKDGAAIRMERMIQQCLRDMEGDGGLE